MKNIPIKLSDQHWDKNTSPEVSVFSWVFNHKEFIRQSIEGILMQETTFQVEILIQDDASTDGTRQIIEEYQSKYPSLFKNIFFSENQYSQGRSIMNNLFTKPKGRYIALTHGDDYWIDPLKLQKQVEFLEKNPNCSCVGGKVNIIDSRNSENKLEYQNQYFLYTKSKKVSENDCLDLMLLPFHTSTYMFRREYLDIKLYNSLFRNSISGDIPLLNFLNAKGEIYYLDYVFGVQHHNSGGVTNLPNHKGLFFLLNRVYMWRNIFHIYQDPKMRYKITNNVNHFEMLLKQKYYKSSLDIQIGLLRQSNILKLLLLSLILKSIFIKLYLRITKKILSFRIKNY
jgi:glycosyltransferase involved in cell wall biosynthesis